MCFLIWLFSMFIQDLIGSSTLHCGHQQIQAFGHKNGQCNRLHISSPKSAPGKGRHTTCINELKNYLNFGKNRYLWLPTNTGSFLDCSVSRGAPTKIPSIIVSLQIMASSNVFLIRGFPVCEKSLRHVKIKLSVGVDSRWLEISPLRPNGP
jgi:hypothetical protein